MSRQGLTGLRRIVSATRNSAVGLSTAWRGEAAFRQECVLAALLLPAAFWIGESTVERVLLIGSMLIVLIVELLNTAVEATVDRVGTDHHELSGQAKDLGSAAVFVSLVLMTVTWGLIAWSSLHGGD